jgi:hypothetical protein
MNKCVPNLKVEDPLQTKFRNKLCPENEQGFKVKVKGKLTAPTNRSLFNRYHFS